MPNLKTDRLTELAGIGIALNVRRLMYQTLIWPQLLRYFARCMGSPLDTEDLERAADALIDCVGGDSELNCDLLGGEMLIDEAEAIELAGAKARHRAFDRRGSFSQALFI